MADALSLWQEKLNFLLQEEAKASDAEQKFKLRQDIGEARTKIGELKSESLAAGIAQDQVISPGPADRQGWARDYSDKTVKSVAVALEEAKPLTMRSLVLNLDVLFNRGTFRFEPLRECVTQEWGRRLLPAMETLELLRTYSFLISDLAPDARSFEKLMDAVNGYCLAMATDLFEEPVKVSEMRDYVGTEEFLTRLPKDKRWPNARDIDDATNKRVDGPRTRAVRLMDKLRKDFLKAPE